MAKASQSLSLPQGGGALQGIGESFSPDLATGTAHFSIPISTPQGRNGLSPQLALFYSSGFGNGFFGLGWSIGTPKIKRKTSKGIPQYKDHTLEVSEKDIFTLSDGHDLVVTFATRDQTHYRPQIESTFSEIIHHHGQGQNFWKVKNKDGSLHFYGTPRPDGVFEGWQDPAVIAHPKNRSQIFSWHLTEIRDTFGNKIVYDYERDLHLGEDRKFDQLYLKSIRYVDFLKNAETQFLISVQFFYEDRKDSFSNYRAGFEIRTRKRCHRIEIHTHAQNDLLSKSYNLHYDNSSQNGVSLLKKVQMAGHNQDQNESWPPLQFDYSSFRPDERDFDKIKGDSLPAQNLSNPNYTLVDLFGNGLPDILDLGQTPRYWKNLGKGKFDEPRLLNTIPHGLLLSDPGVTLFDTNGDGRPDLFIEKENLSGFFELNHQASFSEDSFFRHNQGLSFTFDDPEVKLVDLDGNGVTDAIRSGFRLQHFFYDPKKGWYKTQTQTRQSIETFPNVSFSDPRVHLADMTGDGLKDIVLIADGNVSYWPNLGHGQWGQHVVMQNNPRYPQNFDPKKIIMGDVDGDGVADIIYVDSQKVFLWVNQTGNSWSDVIEISGTPQLTPEDDVRLADLYGVGTSGLLWSKSANSLHQTQYFFLDFTGQIKPYLLRKIDNNRGAETHTYYKSSIEFYLEDEKSKATRWQTHLPFPVQVVDRIEVFDKISGGKTTKQYFYHHGHWDGIEKEFCGFGRVDMRDSETFADYHKKHSSVDIDFQMVSEQQFADPIEIRTWFHQGALDTQATESNYQHEYWHVDQPFFSRLETTKNLLKELNVTEKCQALRSLRRKKIRSEVYALDKTALETRPYTVKEWQHEFREESALHKKVFFAFITSSRKTKWERGDDPKTSFSFQKDYDFFGQPQTSIQIACPRGFRSLENTPSEKYLATCTKITYATPQDDQYLHDRVCESKHFEILSEAHETLRDLLEKVQSQSHLKLLSHTLNYFDGNAFEGLAFGKTGTHGALVRSESLVLTETLLEQIYGHDQIPKYFKVNEEEPWPEEYPLLFRESLPKFAGYIFYSGEDEHFKGLYASDSKQKYDFQKNDLGRGLVLQTQNALGKITSYSHDEFDFLLTEIENPLGLRETAEYDYRLFKAKKSTDANGNFIFVDYSPLGFVTKKAIQGKDGKGDTLENPGVHFEYDLHAFATSGQPTFTTAITHAFHNSDLNHHQQQSFRSISYSDGFGRLLQTRTQSSKVHFGESKFGQMETSETFLKGKKADSSDNPHMIVSGWKKYNNKGQVLESFEPFYSTGWAYRHEEEKKGQKTKNIYDAKGRIIQTVSADESTMFLVHGKPFDLTKPHEFSPSAWEIYTYDKNDNAVRTHPEQSASYKTHWNTPTSVVVDALDRPIESVSRDSLNPDSWRRLKTVYDIQGNILQRKNALGQISFEHFYDLQGKVLKTKSLEAGESFVTYNVLGQPIEARDEKKSLVLKEYDFWGRFQKLWARDFASDSVKLKEFLEYGDGSSSSQTPEEREKNKQANLLGKLYKHFDEAGLVVCEKYDFKGNLLEKVRKSFKDDLILASLQQNKSFQHDWIANRREEDQSLVLQEKELRCSYVYDALNRLIRFQYPEDIFENRQEIRPTFNEADQLQSLHLGEKNFVNHVAYNAKGQRQFIAYGNGVLTRYFYNSKNSRLKNLQSHFYQKTNDFDFRISRSEFDLQNLSYDYDILGNIIKITDESQNAGILNSQHGAHKLVKKFQYNPYYQLVSATGREHGSFSAKPWEDQIRGEDLNQVKAYEQNYSYDLVGNLKELKHKSRLGFTREMIKNDSNNQLSALKIGNEIITYKYDAAGNLVQEDQTRHFSWDFANRLTFFKNQNGNQISIKATYLYDSQGMRHKKFVQKQNGEILVITYVDGVFEHHHLIKNGVEKQNNILHIMDDQSRIATLRVGEAFSSDAKPALQFHLNDHLGSSHIVVDGEGKLINREEYTPFGETSFGSFTKKRFRFGGKEKDEETGLNYHNARYYAPWICRWITVDPAGPVDGLNLYRYALNNPVNLRDCSGLNPDDPPDKKADNTTVLDEVEQKAREYVQEFDEHEKQLGEIKNAEENLKEKEAEVKEIERKWEKGVQDINDIEQELQKVEKELEDMGDVKGKAQKKAQKKLRTRKRQLQRDLENVEFPTMDEKNSADLAVEEAKDNIDRQKEKAAKTYDKKAKAAKAFEDSQKKADRRGASTADVDERIRKGTKGRFRFGVNIVAGIAAGYLLEGLDEAAQANDKDEAAIRARIRAQDRSPSEEEVKALEKNGMMYELEDGKPIYSPDFFRRVRDFTRVFVLFPDKYLYPMFEPPGYVDPQRVY